MYFSPLCGVNKVRHRNAVLCKRNNVPCSWVRASYGKMRNLGQACFVALDFKLHLIWCNRIQCPQNDFYFVVNWIKKLPNQFAFYATKVVFQSTVLLNLLLVWKTRWSKTVNDLLRNFILHPYFFALISFVPFITFPPFYCITLALNNTKQCQWFTTLTSFFLTLSLSLTHIHTHAHACTHRLFTFCGS